MCDALDVGNKKFHPPFTGFVTYSQAVHNQIPKDDLYSADVCDKNRTGGNNRHEVERHMRTKEDRKSRDLVAGGLLKISQAAAFLGLSRSKIYAMIAAGELESTKIGGSRRVPRHAVEQLAARSLAPTSSVA